MGLLEDIVRDVREDLVARKARRPEAELRAAIADRPAPPSLVASLRQGGGPRVIAEIKRASPSRGPIRPDLDPVAVALGYEDAGAAGISVLTEERRFLGSLEDLRQVAAAVSIPVLRKDFIVDPYQILEAREAGAAAVLLIVRLLTDPELERLMGVAHALGLEALVEVHNAEEIVRLYVLQPEIVGVNNRDLDTLAVSLETSRRLAPAVPPTAVKVAESGLSRPSDLASLEPYGYQGFLIGETLMRAADPAAALRALLVDPSGGDATEEVASDALAARASGLDV